MSYADRWAIGVVTACAAAGALLGALVQGVRRA